MASLRLRFEPIPKRIPSTNRKVWALRWRDQSLDQSGQACQNYPTPVCPWHMFGHRATALDKHRANFLKGANPFQILQKGQRGTGTIEQPGIPPASPRKASDNPRKRLAGKSAARVSARCQKYCVWAKLCTTLKPCGIMVCWYLPNSYCFRVSFRWCRISSIHSIIAPLVDPPKRTTPLPRTEIGVFGGRVGWGGRGRSSFVEISPSLCGMSQTAATADPPGNCLSFLV